MHGVKFFRNIDGKRINGRISILVLMVAEIPIPIFSNKFQCFDCCNDFKIKNECITKPKLH